MNENRLFKFGALAVAVILWLGAGWWQRELNRQRADPALGLTRAAPLENAPPMLAFTTVALGSFRGLIANALWIRANDLQEQGKYFENVQLADWITKLEPHFAQVWVHQAWNMAYNLSVKFNNHADRWRWVSRGIELLRDDGLRYNPTEALIYREIAWFYQHKISQNMDDAHWYYKREIVKQMTEALGSGSPNFDELIQPQTDDARRRATLLREKYKLDPARMKAVDAQYGPLDWRLPDAHAIYWAALGLEKSGEKNQVTLRRAIYQSMFASIQRGRLIYWSPAEGTIVETGPNLALADKAHAAYEQLLAEEPDGGQREGIKRAHRNFLRDIVYLSYSHNRPADMERWFKTLREKYPDAVPPGLTAEEFSLQRYTDNVADLSYDRMKALVEGLIRRHLLRLAVDEDEAAAGHEQVARRLWAYYDEKSGGQQRLKLPPFAKMKQDVLDQWLDPQSGLDPILVGRLRTKLSLPAPTSAPSTNTLVTPKEASKK